MLGRLHVQRDDREQLKSRRPVMNTYAPLSTNRFAAARPIPMVPPVTSPIFPSSLPLFVSPCKPASLAPCSQSSERDRLLRRSMRSAIRVALTYSLDQRAPRT